MLPDLQVTDPLEIKYETPPKTYLRKAVPFCQHATHDVFNAASIEAISNSMHEECPINLYLQ